MLSFLQPILSYSRGGGEGTFISVPFKPLHSTCSRWQASTGRRWKIQGARHHLHLAANATSYVALGIQASRSLLPPSALPMHRMSPSSLVPGTYMYRRQAHAFLDVFGAVLIPQPNGQAQAGCFPGSRVSPLRARRGTEQRAYAGCPASSSCAGIQTPEIYTRMV